MLQIEVITKGIGGLVLIVSLIITPVAIGLFLAYIIDKNWRSKVNTFFLKGWLNLRGFFSGLFRKRKKKLNQIVFCKLGDPMSEAGRDGVIFIRYKGDGKAVKEVVGKEFVRRRNNKNGDHYFYFAFTKEIVDRFRKKPIVIFAEYLDQDRGRGGSTEDNGKRGLRLKYDAIGDDFRWKKAGHVSFTDFAGGWKWAGFNIKKDGNFQRRQNEVADFRIACRYANPQRDYDLFLRRVMVVAL